MTDIFATESAPAPMAAPAPVTTTATLVSETAPVPAAPQRTEFDDQLDAFLDRDLLAEMNGTTEAPPAVVPAVQAPAVEAASPGAQPAAGAPAIQPAPANGGTPPATTTQPAPAVETATTEVDPGLLMQMFGGTPPAQPAAPAAPAAAPASPAPADDDTIPMPFTADLNLPDALVQTIFQSEDPVQQKQALQSLMAALGNAVVGYVETRQREVHAPRIAQQFEAAQQARTQAAAVAQHFYGAYPELAPYKEVVTRAGNIVMSADPNATYSEETAKKIADLARGALKQMGKDVTPAAPAATPAAPAAPAQPTAPRPVATPYMAGGATPGGPLETPGDPNSPASVLDEMQNGWFN